MTISTYAHVCRCSIFILIRLPSLISTRACTRIASCHSILNGRQVVTISTRACTRIARAWNKSQTLSGPVLFLSRASCKIPISKEYTRCFAQIMVSCWTYFLPGFCRAVPVISTPALLSLGRSKRTRLCCYPIL